MLGTRRGYKEFSDFFNGRNESHEREGRVTVPQRRRLVIRLYGGTDGLIINAAPPHTFQPGNINRRTSLCSHIWGVSGDLLLL
jgi:hypothetical protein